MSSTALLKCEIQAGLFPDECTVVVATRDFGNLSFFCPTDFIDKDNLRIAVLETSGEDVLVRLPAETAVGTVVVVSKALVREHAIK